MTYQPYLDAFHAVAMEELACLHGVYEKLTDECWDKLLLRFERSCLVLTAKAEDDTLEVLRVDAISDETEWRRIDGEEPWQAYLGLNFGWGWITINQQGYCDGALLSFEGITPTLLISVAGSSLHVSKITPVPRAMAAIV